MPEPVTTSELLLQRIADRLDSIADELRRGSERPQPVKKPARKKAPSTPDRVDVDGD